MFQPNRKNTDCLKEGRNLDKSVFFEGHQGFRDGFSCENRIVLLFQELIDKG